MAKEISGPGGVPGFELNRKNDPRPLKMYVFGPGKYDFGAAKYVRQVSVSIGNVIVNEQDHLSDSFGRGMNIDKGKPFAIEVPEPHDAVLFVYDFPPA